MRLNEDEDGGGDTFTTEIAPSPLTTGVSELGYNWISSLTVSPPASVLVRSADGLSALIGNETLRAGTLVLSGDSNAFTDNSNGFFQSADNGLLVKNLCG